MPGKPMVSGSFVAPIYLTPPLTIGEFINASKPGNVAICLSGGGSRALSAGIGQLKALETVTLSSNSLLSQAIALSTVSGGSWLGVPFAYLPPFVSDTDFLGGPYVPPGQLTVEGLATFPKGCIAEHITSDFSIPDMLWQAFFLYWDGVPADMLWQTIIALHLLWPYELFPKSGSAEAAASFFTYDKRSRDSILNLNPSLKSEAGSLVSSNPRPYLLCNTAMFVTVNGESLLAPVQATSFFTGIVGEPPNAIDANGLEVGGGGVTSFEFSSEPTAVNSALKQVTAKQCRQWALVDIVGSSSAAFAATLQQHGYALATNPALLSEYMREHAPAAANFLGRRGVDTTAGEKRLSSALAATRLGSFAEAEALTSFLDALIPAYQYWSVVKPPVGQKIGKTLFADGGSLENSGVASALAYTDVNNVIAFTNTSTPITVVKVKHEDVIVVDDTLPPLFGYQPFVPDLGYKLYSGNPILAGPLFRNNQVFPSEAFQDLLNNLWATSGSGLYENPPIYFQKGLSIQENPWFKVTPVSGRPQVNVLWVYLERCKIWYDQLSSSVKKELGPFDDMVGNFPHYSVLDTELTATQINLLANYTAWVIMHAQTTFKSAFQG